MAEVGRPTKYNEELQKKADQYVDETSHPYIEELALKLDINDDTINRWTKVSKKTKKPKKPLFYATIKKLKMKQLLALKKKSIDKDYATAGAIFQMKANHGMIETTRNINEVHTAFRGADIVIIEKEANGAKSISETNPGPEGTE